MKLVYCGPHARVEVDVLGARPVDRGVPVDVPDPIAGTPPDPDYVRIMAALADPLLTHEARSALIAELAGTDPGSGLLAQPANWQPAAAAKPTTTKDGVKS
jgi:hypothetical protein